MFRYRDQCRALDAFGVPTAVGLEYLHGSVGGVDAVFQVARADNDCALDLAAGLRCQSEIAAAERQA